MNYPPFSHMVKVEMSGRKEKTVEAEINSIAKSLSHFAERAGVTLLGPGFAPQKKIGENYRCQVFCKGGQVEKLLWVVKSSLAGYSPSTRRGLKLTVDVDPVSVM